MLIKNEYNILYKYPRVGNIGLFLFTWVIITTLIFLMPVYFTPSMDYGFYLSYLFIFMLIFPIFYILYVYTHSYWHDINKFYIENIPNEINFDKNKEYAGVVIANNNLRLDKYFHIYNGIALLLIENLRNKNKAIKIIKNTNEKDFRELVYDKNCNELYLLCHGRKYRFTLHKNKHINFEKFSDAPKKKRIEHFHCCHKANKGKSLSEILDADEKYKSNKTRTIDEVVNYGVYELLFN